MHHILYKLIHHSNVSKLKSFINVNYCPLTGIYPHQGESVQISILNVVLQLLT